MNRYFHGQAETLLEGEDRTPYQMPGLHVIGSYCNYIIR